MVLNKAQRHKWEKKSNGMLDIPRPDTELTGGWICLSVETLAAVGHMRQVPLRRIKAEKVKMGCCYKWSDGCVCKLKRLLRTSHI